MTKNSDFLQYFKEVPKTGVIYVLERATQMGYSSKDPSWANLGQGAPDTENISGDPIHKQLHINAENSEYAPVAGLLDLRKKVADYYNQIFRKQSDSKYTYKNVCIAGGGRMALARLVASFGHINMGHFIPDYTAYEELLSAFKTFIPIPILLKQEHGYKLSLEALQEEISGKGLSALLISNPCNPTGQYLQDKELMDWVKTANDYRCMMIFDEFYSHYIYDAPNTVLSAARYIENVNEDPVIIINGLSKNWRSPGFRIGWVLGPESVIEKVSSVGSFMDGGAVHPLQEEAIRMINPETVYTEAEEIQTEFREKRNIMLSYLKKMNIDVKVEPKSTFYCWCDISRLPSPLNSSDVFFEECLKEKVIVVPGEFFDVNPGKRRLVHQSRYKTYVRISFGPKKESLITGLNSIQRVINKFT
jgi:aspartate/methionine/tyrosine aminotransferase